MSLSRRSRRSPTQTTGESNTAVPGATAGPPPPAPAGGAAPAVETARMRRERRTASHLAPASHLSPSRWRAIPSARQSSSDPKHTKPIPRTSSVSRNKAFRSRSIGTPPPVYMRGGMVNLPVQPRKLGAPPKRRHNVALSVPGAELHLPALPVLRMSWRVFSGLLAAIMLALAVHLWFSTQYRIDMVDVTGLQRLTGNDINTVLGLGGQPIFAVDPQKIRKDLQQAFPDMKNVSVKVSLPARVVVKAEERQPVIAWNQDGREQWVDLEGNAFPPRGKAGRLIHVQAQNDPPTIEKASVMESRFLTPEMVGVIIRMAMKAPKASDLLAQDTALLYDSEHGLGWKDAFDCQVYFGTDMKDMDQKLLVYQALAARLQKDGIQAMLINVAFVHAPYYRLEP